MTQTVSASQNYKYSDERVPMPQKSMKPEMDEKEAAYVWVVAG